MNKLWGKSRRDLGTQFYEEEGQQYVHRINEDSLLKNVTRRTPARIGMGFVPSSGASVAPSVSQGSVSGNHYVGSAGSVVGGISSGSSVYSSKSRRKLPHLEEEASYQSGYTMEAPRSANARAPMQKMIESK